MDGHNDFDFGRMAVRFVSQSVSTSNGKIPRAIYHQPFHSLDNSGHYDRHNSSRTFRNSYNHNHHNSKESPLLSPKPSLLFNPVASLASSRESPPSSPFDSKNTTSTMTTPKTPSSIRTAETESIASLSSCSTVNTNLVTTTPLNNRPSIVPPHLFPYHCQYHTFHHHSCVTNAATMHHYPLEVTTAAFNNNNNLRYQSTSKQFQAKKKKQTKNRYLELQSSLVYDSSNHSRYSSSSNSTSPGLDNNDSMHSSLSLTGSNHSNRIQKVKTELCMYYLKDEVCPFGTNCHYAHGEEELKIKGLMELQNRGLIEDASTYRIKPCFSHVAMGSW